MNQAGFYPYPGAPMPNAPHPTSMQGPSVVYPTMAQGAFGFPAAGNISANSIGVGAVFKKRVERIDWRKLAALDVDRITRDMDLQSLQENLMNITFCNLESEVDCRNMDPNFTKLFKVAQLSIEYLLYSQDYLANVMASLESRLNSVMIDHEMTKGKLEKQKQELVLVKKESHKRKKLLAAQQQILHSGPNSYHKCPVCPKAFVHESYCTAHIHRRHPEHVVLSGNVQSAPVSPTGRVTHHSSHVTQITVQSQIEQELREVKERLRATERQLQETEALKGQAKPGTEPDEHQRLLESLKAREREKQREEFEQIRQMFLAQFEELNNKYLDSERQLLKLRGKSDTGLSNLGDLADDTDTEGGSRASRVTKLKNRMALQYHSEERSLKDQIDDHSSTLTEQHRAEIARLDAVLKSSRPAISPPSSLPNTPKHGAHGTPVHQRNGHVTPDADAVVPISEEVMSRETAATAASAARDLSKMDMSRTAPASSIAQKRTYSPLTSPRASSPAKKQRERNLSPGERAVYDRSEDDAYDDEESELQEVNQEFAMWTNEEALKRAHSHSSLDSAGPADLGTDESLIATAVRSARLNKQLRTDPRLLKGLLIELEELLAEQLEEKGITRDLNGISNVVLNNKLDVMEKDREIMERKYPNFHKIRRQYERKVHREALAQLAHIKAKNKINDRAPHKTKSSSMPNLAADDMPDRGATSPRSPRRTTPKKVTTPSPVPKHQARSPIVVKRDMSPRPSQPPPRISTTLSTEYSSAGQTTTVDDNDDVDGEREYTSADDDSAEEEETASKESVEGHLAAPGFKGQNVKIIMSGPPVPPPRSPEAPKSPGKTPREEAISEWDSTETSDIKPTVKARGTSNTSVPQMSKSIESQLKARGGNVRHAGSVNTVPGLNRVTIATPSVQPEEEDDDLSISVSSLQDLPKPAPAPRKVQASAEGEFSTNTGGTSVWGSVSKGPGAHIVGKSSQSLTDWDSDLDPDDL